MNFETADYQCSLANVRDKIQDMREDLGLIEIIINETQALEACALRMATAMETIDECLEAVQ